MLFGYSSAGAPNPPVLPNSSLTPGDVLSTDTRAVCTPGYSKKVRNVPSALKKQVYKMYDIKKGRGQDWEVDHLISLELGGSNSIRNLWPEAGFTQPLNYHVKDSLENAMHDLVCSGRLKIQDAQREIASNWALAYKTHLGNLPNGIDPSKAVSASVNSAVTNMPIQPPTSNSGGLSGSRANGSSGSVPPNADGSCPPEAPIKGSKSMIYHVPENRDYERTHAKACFATTDDALKAGYRAPKN